MNNNYLIILMTYAIALFLIGLKADDKGLKLMIGLLLGLIPIAICCHFNYE